MIIASLHRHKKPPPKAVTNRDIRWLGGDSVTKDQMKELMKQAIDPHKICRVFLNYDVNYFYYFPLTVGERLFLGVEEDDFIIDGYSIRRFRDVVKVEIKDDKCLEIVNAEGILENLVIPDVDITDWNTSIASLQKLGKNIIIKKDSLSGQEAEFFIGKIVKVMKKKVLFRGFDADGIWDDDLTEIPFSKITSITFGSRYVEVFSKYLPPLSI